MRVAIYSSPLNAVRYPTGVGLHIKEMIRYLGDATGLNVSMFATRREFERGREFLFRRESAIPIHFLPGPEPLMRAALTASSLGGIEWWSGAVDWVYCPKEQPVSTRRAKLAVTVHDVLPFEASPLVTERPSWRWRLIMRRILERANLIATVSEFTRARIVDLFGKQYDERIAVVGNGVSREYRDPPRQGEKALLEKHGLVERRFVVAVGSLTHRKGGDRLLRIAEAFSRQNDAMRIVVTGRRHDRDLLARYEDITRRDPHFPMTLLGYVTAPDQASLLRSSAALVFPSRYEGFGIPVLEAMAVGTPAVCSRAGALPEVGGGAAVYVDDPDTPAAWIDVLGSLDSSDSLRRRVVDAGRLQVKEATWDRVGARLVSALRFRS